MIRITIISNICFEPYLKSSFSKAFGCNVKTSYVYLNNIYEVRTIDADFVLLHISIEEFAERTKTIYLNAFSKKCEEIYNTIQGKTNAQILWLGFEDYCLKYHFVYGRVLPFYGLADRLNISAYEVIQSTDTFIDFKRIIAEVGIKDSYNDRGKYRWNSPYTEKLINEIANEVHNQYCVTFCKTKKCLVLDCDGVLWDGILNEDGIDGINISRKYADFQNFVLHMYNSGVILCLCTKNDEDILVDGFKNHSGMILKEKHFSVIKANYNSKVENIKEISYLLNISTDSIVFIDDSENEIQEMHTFLPEVKSILFNPYSVYEELSCFKLNEDTLKMAEIRVANYRQKEKSSHSFDCNGITEIHVAIESELKRISELTMRTNQRTNGRRFTVGNLKSSGSNIFAVYYRDSVSDYGLIGAIAVKNYTLELFSLSCRVIGKGIEKKMTDYLKRNYTIKEISYIDTKKNKAFFEWLEEELL